MSVHSKVSLHLDNIADVCVRYLSECAGMCESVQVIVDEKFRNNENESDKNAHNSKKLKISKK